MLSWIQKAGDEMAELANVVNLGKVKYLRGCYREHKKRVPG